MDILLFLLRGTIIKKLRRAKKTERSINSTLKALGLPEILSGLPNFKYTPKTPYFADPKIFD